jgi:thiol-disulfide isomerase/thioredoxin
VTKLSPWQARLLHRATRVDIAYAGAVLVVGVMALWSGNAAARHLSPDGARSASELLDELELPRVLPNAALARDDGGEARLWDLTRAPRTLVTFYAPWCGPCQKELPVLARGTADHPEQLVVLVGADEDPAEVRTRLDDLGLQALRFHVDTTREVESGGRVMALPTTFIVGPMGRVRERVVGYAGYRLQMLLYKVTAKGQSFAIPDGD